MLIAQLSDPHVAAEGSFLRSLVDTPARFVAALDTLATFPTTPDVILLTGDLVNDASVTEYGLLTECLQHAPAPIVAVPGNHDHPRRLRDTIARLQPDLAPPPLPDPDAASHYVVDDWPVRLVALDSTRRGYESGEITAASAEWLDRTLAQAPDTPTIVLTHHTPYPTGSWWFDYQGVAGAPLLRSVLDRHPHVTRVVAGHVHRNTHTQWGPLILSTAGSTAFQTGNGAGGRDDTPPLIVDQSAPATILWWNGDTIVASEADPPGPAQRVDLRDISSEWSTYADAARAGEPITTDRDTTS